MPKIQTVKSPKKADAKVFRTNNKNRADLYVCIANSDDDLSSEAIWKFTDKKSDVDFKVHFVDKSYKSNLKIYLVNTQKVAGWNKNHRLRGKIERSKNRRLLTFKEFINNTSK